MTRALACSLTSTASYMVHYLRDQRRRLLSWLSPPGTPEHLALKEQIWETLTRTTLRPRTLCARISLLALYATPPRRSPAAAKVAAAISASTGKHLARGERQLRSMDGEALTNERVFHVFSSRLRHAKPSFSETRR